MSEIKVNKISPRSGTDVTLGDSGDTFTIPSGATINNQGTATNFGATGSASWTTTVKTSTFTAVAGEGYFVNTTGGAVSVNLPAGVAGAVVAIKDYAGTFDTNGCTLVQNGSDKIGGSTDNKLLSTEGIAATLIFIDSTQGWLVTDDGLQSIAGVTNYSIDFLVIAGGASGAVSTNAGNSEGGGGGGAGGFRTSTQTVGFGTAITVTVGDGGASQSGANSPGNDGSDSSISGTGLTTITSTGGGGGGNTATVGRNGGSGGGGGASPAPNYAGGSGDTPATTPAQGNNGGAGTDNSRAGGGGGAGAVGVDATNGKAGDGGAGLASTITGGSVIRAGGGGGGNYNSGSSVGLGGSGGGGDGGSYSSFADGSAGTINTGSGGGGSSFSANTGAGGKGVVILNVPTDNYSGTTTGSPTITISGSNTIMTFTGTGSYTT